MYLLVFSPKCTKWSEDIQNEELSKLRRKYDKLSEGKGFMRLLAALAGKQKAIAEPPPSFVTKKNDFNMIPSESSRRYKTPIASGSQLRSA